MASGLFDQQLDLFVNIQRLLMWEIITCVCGWVGRGRGGREGGGGGEGRVCVCEGECVL